MCYNNDCKIEIVSRVDGSEMSYKLYGNVTKTPSETRFDYTLDGDECTLIINDTEIVQSRRGKQNIKMTFRKGEETECFLESGGFSGAFTVYTRNIQFKIGQLYTLLIVYTLGEDEIELDFTAENNLKVEK